MATVSFRHLVSGGTEVVAVEGGASYREAAGRTDYGECDAFRFDTRNAYAGDVIAELLKGGHKVEFLSAGLAAAPVPHENHAPADRVELRKVWDDLCAAEAEAKAFDRRRHAARSAFRAAVLRAGMLDAVTQPPA